MERHNEMTFNLQYKIHQAVVFDWKGDKSYTKTHDVMKAALKIAVVTKEITPGVVYATNITAVILIGYLTNDDQC